MMRFAVLNAGGLYACTSFQEELHKRVDPDQLPVEYGGTGKLGLRSIDDLFIAKKAFEDFETPEFRAMLARDLPRTKLNLGSAEALEAAKFLDVARSQDANGGGAAAAAVNPKGAGYALLFLEVYAEPRVVALGGHMRVDATACLTFAFSTQCRYKKKKKKK